MDVLDLMQTLNLRFSITNRVVCIFGLITLCCFDSGLWMCMLPEFLIQSECAVLGASMCSVKCLATVKLYHSANKKGNKGLREQQLLRQKKLVQMHAFSYFLHMLLFQINKTL